MARKIVTDPVALFTLVLAVFTLGLIVVGKDQHRAAMDALKLASDEFHATHRPKLRIRNIDIQKVGDHPVSGRFTFIEPDERVQGQFFIANVGTASAVLTEAYFMLLGTTWALPMRRPYEGEPANCTFEPSEIGPGQVAVGRIDHGAVSQVIGDNLKPTFINPHGNARLFALGWVEYTDASRKRRWRAAYCRMWSGDDARFLHLKDDGLDYDNEE